MDWIPKTPFQWDWETLELFSGKESELSKPAQVPDSKIGGGASICDGSVCSSNGGASSVLELGNRSSKSSISASIDFLSETGERKSQFNFDSAEQAPYNLNKSIFARVKGSGTSPASVTAGYAREPLTGLKLGRTSFEDGGAGNNIKNFKMFFYDFGCQSLTEDIMFWPSFRFHGLSEFDQNKRSCRRRLSDHNARRRKPQPMTISFSSPRISSSDHGIT
ncbi:hypothetical protein GW17_00000438 [Ensete ventricosum]|nr:hypothetical protein GW17_00000438 [Ensete ventricosum]